MVREHERVILTADFPEHGLKAGDVGVVVLVYRSGEAYEIEFFTLDGNTLDVITVEGAHIRPVSSMDALHDRAIRSPLIR